MRRTNSLATGLLYALFAVISTGVNLGVQYLADLAYAGPLSLYVSLIAGTGVGLITKYVLDKKWIFAYDAGGLGGDVKTFLLYSLMGIATTAVFWITELAFNRFVPLENAKFLGGALGLCAGYTAKYFLDRSLVFTKPKENPSA